MKNSNKSKIEGLLKKIDPSARVNHKTGAVSFGTDTKGHKLGHALLKRVDENNKRVSIRETSNNAPEFINYRVGQKSGGTINFDISVNRREYTVNRGATMRVAKMPAFIILAHEIIHADHAMRRNGITVDADINNKQYTDITGQSVSANKEELRTVGLDGNRQRGDITENDIRFENNIRNRARYTP